MKKDMYAYYGIPMPEPFDLDSFKVDPVESSDPARAILQAVYALDPVTRLPTGDIMCYLSPSTPSEIKQYIIDSIMVDTSSQRLPSLPDGLDEDTAFALERHIDEPVDAYRQRITQYMEQQANIRDMAIDNARQQAVSKPAE